MAAVKMIYHKSGYMWISLCRAPKGFAIGGHQVGRRAESQ